MLCWQTETVSRGDASIAVMRSTAVTARMLAESMIHRRHRHHGPLAAHAWQFRHSLSYYDSLYVALAERLGCPVITADRRIMRALPDHELIKVISRCGVRTTTSDPPPL